MLSFLLSLLFALPTPRPPRPILEITARQLFGNFVAGHFEAATKDFNEEMKEMASPAVLAEMKKRTEAAVGGFKHISEVHKRLENGFQSVEVISEWEKAPVSMVVTFDHRKRVGSVTINPILPEPIDPGLEATAREVLANFAARRFAEMSARFDATMQAQLPASRLATLHADVARLFGAFRSVTAVRQETAQQLRILDLTAAYEKEPVTVRVVFDPSGKVAGLYISPYVAKKR